MKSRLNIEREYHDKVAGKYFLKRKTDFTWEVPEELYLLKPKYFDSKTIIDMGCGPALSIARMLKEKMIDKYIYYGIDISSKMLNIAKKNINDGIFICRDISDLNNLNLSADTILSLGALHHIYDKEKALTRWLKMINNNGYLLLREPTYRSLRRGMGASPFEEGIKTGPLLDELKHNNMKIITLKYFRSPLFHIVNKIFNKFLSKYWLEKSFLWYTVVEVDIFISTYIARILPYFIGDSFILVAQKV